MTWTKFTDMHSGGQLKEAPFKSIYIEAPEDEARMIFYNRFGHSASRVTCRCCGSDYWSIEYDSDGEAHTDIQEAIFYKVPVLIIPAVSIKEEERAGYVPEEDD